MKSLRIENILRSPIGIISKFEFLFLFLLRSNLKILLMAAVSAMTLENREQIKMAFSNTITCAEDDK